MSQSTVELINNSIAFGRIFTACSFVTDSRIMPCACVSRASARLCFFVHHHVTILDARPDLELYIIRKGTGESFVDGPMTANLIFCCNSLTREDIFLSVNALVSCNVCGQSNVKNISLSRSLTVRSNRTQEPIAPNSIFTLLRRF